MSTEHDAESVIIAKETPGPDVDPPDRAATFADVTGPDDARRPIVPAWLRSKDQRRQAGRWALGLGAHTALYHLTRSPKYLLKVAWYAPRGLTRGLHMAIWWARAEEGNWHLRQAAATAADAQTWLALDRARERQSSWRWWPFGGGVLGLAAAICLLAGLAPGWLQFAAAVAAVLGLARLGRPVGKPITDRVSQSPVFRKLTADMMRRALVATGEIKDPTLISFPHEIHRNGPGYLAIVDLPDGVVATDIIEKRPQLAGGLRLPLDQVWPEAVRGEHPGRLHTWVGDRPVSQMRPPTSRLLADDLVVDYFRPFPYGYDPRLRPADWLLAERNSLFAGVPGSGKSLAARNVILGAILDPLVVPAGFDLKGTGDFEPIAPLCPPGLYGSGADEATKEGADRLLDWLLAECERRGPIIKDYVRRGLSQENKLNRAMAERDPRLRPVIAWIDECQELFTDKVLGKPAIAKSVSIVKRGRALGIHLILMTQRIDKDSIPKGISSNIVNRLCLAVTSHIETDLVLGTGAYRAGARPTQFEPGDGAGGGDPGWGWRVGIGKSGPVRAEYLDNAAAKRIVARAVALRATVDEPEAPLRVQVRNLLEDVRRVWIDGEEALWSELIVPRLQALDRDVYGDLTVEVFGARMAAAGVPTSQIGRRIDGKPTTRRGVRLAELTAALAGRRQRGLTANTQVSDGFEG